MIRPVQKQLYAVIGHPVAHSLSPAMMNRAFAAAGYPGCYLAFEVTDLAQDLELLHRLGVRGVSVTLPHKKAVLDFCEAIDPTARAIGAVNTLRRTERAWEGRNTDWLGVRDAFAQVTAMAGKTALVIGAGGAARAAVYALCQAGARTLVTNRSRDRGIELARAFACEFVELGEATERRFDLVAQCTSAGMAGREPVPFPSTGDFFRPGMVVLDAVYRPLCTDFLRRAEAAGCRTVTGLEMLLHQGCAQFAWWTGRPAPTAAMRSALRQALEGETDAHNH